MNEKLSERMFADDPIFSKYAREVESLEAECDALITMLEVTRKGIRKLEQEVKQRKDDVIEVLGKKNDVIVERDALNEQIRELKKDNEAQHRYRDAADDAQIKAQTENTQFLMDKNAAADDEVKKLKEQIKTKNIMLDNSEQIIKNINKANEALEAEVKRLTDAIIKLNTETIEYEDKAEMRLAKAQALVEKWREANRNAPIPLEEIFITCADELEEALGDIK